MRRNLSYRGGAQRGARPAATNPQPAGFVATQSMQLLRYSLFTPRRYELNMSSTSNSCFPFFCTSSGQTGGCINYSAPTTVGTCRRKKLGRAFFPTVCGVSPPAAAATAQGSHMRQYGVRTDQHLGLFTHAGNEPLCYSTGR